VRGGILMLFFFVLIRNDVFMTRLSLQHSPCGMSFINHSHLQYIDRHTPYYISSCCLLYINLISRIRTATYIRLALFYFQVQVHAQGLMTPRQMPVHQQVLPVHVNCHGSKHWLTGTRGLSYHVNNARYRYRIRIRIWPRPKAR